MGKMFAEERRNVILNKLQKEKRLTVKELASSLDVSEATLRMDFNYMENKGLLTRTHGGAVLNENIPPKNNFTERAMKNIDSKISIADKAINLIQYKNSILLDASTTALELARKLKQTDLKITVVTSGLTTAIELKENPNINVIVLGGLARMGSMALEGTIGSNILNSINIDIMFSSASGFTIEEGLTDFNVYEVELKKQMVAKSDRLVALIDNTKLGTSSIATFAPVEQIDTLITDVKPSNEFIEALASKNIELIY